MQMYVKTKEVKCHVKNRKKKDARRIESDFSIRKKYSNKYCASIVLGCDWITGILTSYQVYKGM